MKAFYLLTFLIVAYLQSGAQPVITEDITPTIGDSWLVTLIPTVDDFNPGPGGLNQTWDFSDLDLSEALDVEIEILDQSEIEGSTYDDVEFVWHLTGFNVYNYYASNEDSLYQLAGASISGGTINFESIFSDPEDGLHFPLTYGDDYDYYSKFDQVVFGIPLAPAERYGNLHADGFGTVITPKGTYQDVLRVINTQVSEGITTVQYAWLNAENFVPVFIYEESDDASTVPTIYFSEPQSSSVNTFELPSIDDKWTAWYESASHRIHLNFEDLSLEGASSLRIFTLDGRLLKNVDQIQHLSHQVFSVPVPTDLQTTSLILSLQTAGSKVSTRIITAAR